MTKSKSPLTHPLSTARGLGSAKEGTHHWLMQRVTAITLVPLVLWFIYAFVTMMVGATREEAGMWFASPFNAIGLAILLLAMFYHAKLGLQVVIEDYVHCACAKTGLIIGLYLLTFTLMVVSSIAILKLHLIGI